MCVCVCVCVCCEYLHIIPHQDMSFHNNFPAVTEASDLLFTETLDLLRYFHEVSLKSLPQAGGVCLCLQRHTILLLIGRYLQFTHIQLLKWREDTAGQRTQQVKGHHRSKDTAGQRTPQVKGHTGEMTSNDVP